MKTPKAKALIVAACVITCLAAGAAVHIIPRMRLGWQANLILADVTRVEAYRVMSGSEADDLAADGHVQNFGPTSVKVDGCYVLATAAKGGGVSATQISRILLTEGTYTSDKVDCMTQPGVVFRLLSGGRSLDVILCFHCGELMTQTHDANGGSVEGVYTLMAGRSYHDFADLAKNAFPNDPEIQKIGKD